MRAHHSLKPYILLPFIFVILDYCAVLLATTLAYNLRNILVPNGGTLHLSWQNVHIISPFIYISYLAICKLYSRDMQFWRIIEQIFKANTYAILTGIMLMYILQEAATTSRLYIALLWFFSIFLITFFRYTAKKILARNNLFRKPVLLMGVNKTAELILKYTKKDPGLNYHFVGYLGDHKIRPLKIKTFPYLGTFKNAERAIKQTGVQHILVSMPEMDPKQIEKIIYDLQPFVKNIDFVPDLGNIPVSNMDIESLIDGRIAMFQIKNNLLNRWNRILKFVFDWTLTLLGTFFILPVLAGIALWIHHDSPGPILFKHKRIGKNGKEFYCYKFRSMVVDADKRLKTLLEADPRARAEWQKEFKLKNDPRITKSGIFLRKTSLDELPQIFNVLKGEMSLVGPRPIIQAEVSKYGQYIKDYYMVRPGITGIWQTSGRSDISYEDRVQMDTWYVRNWNIWFDIVLLWRTFSVALGRKGAY